MNNSLNKRELLSNFLIAVLAQGSAVLMSLITSLLLPKTLGVAEYGYWQLFIFYTGYAGLCHFGISEGVYLLNGGKTRDDLDKRSLGSQLRFSVAYQSLVALLLALYGFVCLDDGKRVFVVVATSVFILLNNATYYLGYIFQAVNETKKFSFSVMIDRLTFVVPLLVMLAMGVINFESYVYFYAASKIIALAYCCWQGRNIVFAPSAGIRNTIGASIESIRVGIKLMLANLMSMLVLGVARFAIDASWGIEVFSQISLSLSMTNFFLQFIAQVSLVLFPALRRVDREQLVGIYGKINRFLSLVLPAIYLIYWPLALFVGAWLPEYGNSIIYLSLLLPVCVYDGKMNVCFSTFYKVLRREKSLFAVNLLALSVSVVLCLAGVYLFRSPAAVVAGAMIGIIARSVVSELHLDRAERLSKSNMILWNLLIAACFVLSAFLFGYAASFVATLVVYVVFLLNNKSSLREIAVLSQSFAGRGK